MTNYTCYKCKKEYGSDEIRLNADRKLVCVYCLGTKKHAEVKEPKIDKIEETIEYVCNNCHYLFKRKASVLFMHCPYCGQEGKIIAKKNMDSDMILSDSMDAKYSY
ncbi:TPA: hypothetical protein HA239_05740 [Candidatus Woesearchaeota archaeon]|nr:hypothetical protein QT06_C0001G1220 [archaeon GW2011_AR15]MBS3104315.1 hypothetical protein [Candidatus Woesearchaeota archaeon]HIH41881.1 hypothetical protein [Candidatus Woesearchaeota archaeon]